METDCPSNPNQFEKQNDIDLKPHELEKEDDRPVKNLERFSSSCRTREKSPLPCSQSQKRRNIGLKGGGVKSRPPKSRKHDDVERQKLNAIEKVYARKIASDFKSEDPFFMVSMQPSYVGLKYLLNVPYCFATKYLVNERGHVILKVPNAGKTWYVQYSFGTYGINAKAKLEYGWKAFVRDNDLKVGDVCVFVLTKSTEILFEVSIFRINGTAISSVLPAELAATFKAGQSESFSSKLESDTMIKKAGKSQFRSLKTVAGNGKTENSFFTVTLGSPYATTVPSSFRIPLKFAKTYINKIEGEGILKVSDGNRSWSVLYKVKDRLNRSPVAELFRGWSAFARDNSLEEGDICTFELINGNDISFKVFILKANQDLPHQSGKSVADGDLNYPIAIFKTESTSCQDHETCNAFKIGQIAEEESDCCHRGEINVEPGDKFGKAPSKDHRTSSRVTNMVSSSTNPYFKVELRASSCLNLHLPLSFAEKHFEPKEQNVTLQVGKKMWQVMMVVCSSGYIFSGGWPAFSRENNLEPGDYCVFELVRKEEDQVLLKVSKVSSPTSRSS